MPMELSEAKKIDFSNMWKINTLKEKNNSWQNFARIKTYWKEEEQI